MHAWIADSLDTDTTMEEFLLENPNGGTVVAPEQTCKKFPQPGGYSIQVIQVIQKELLQASILQLDTLFLSNLANTT